MKKSELKEIIKASFLAEAEDSKKGNKEERKRMEGAIRDDRDHIKNLEKDIKDNEAKLAKLKKDEPKDISEEMKKDDMDEAMRGGDDDMDEGMRGTYEEDDIKEADEVDVDVDEKEDIDVDIEDDVDVDDVSDKSEIEVDSELAGEGSDVTAILGLLTKAQEKAKSMGDDKLLDQIGNTITYYTRAHVVATNEDLESGEYGDPVDAELDVTKGDGDTASMLDAEAALNLEEINRFRKLAGLNK
tara:strand:- start:12 stop:740 length:729 start_codon:yes stop_codon:yes gene_type:complete